MKNNFVVIFVTCPSKKMAGSIADLLLKKRLVACASIAGNIESRFWWNGKIDKAEEALMILKTSADNFKAVEKEVKKLHSYEVPEIVALPIAALNGDYARWIEDSIKGL